MLMDLSGTTRSTATMGENSPSIREIAAIILRNDDKIATDPTRIRRMLPYYAAIETDSATIAQR